MDVEPRSTWRLWVRMGLGLIWIAGAFFNLVWTLRQPNVFGQGGFAGEAGLTIYRWFFREVIAPAPTFWTVLLVLGEAALGAQTLAKGAWARAGLWGSALWSLWLFPLMWPYTIMMGPFALVPLWLLRGTQDVSAIDLLRRRAHRPGAARPGHA